MTAMIAAVYFFANYPGEWYGKEYSVTGTFWLSRGRAVRCEGFATLPGPVDCKSILLTNAPSFVHADQIECSGKTVRLRCGEVDHANHSR